METGLQLQWLNKNDPPAIKKKQLPPDPLVRAVLLSPEFLEKRAGGMSPEAKCIVKAVVDCSMQGFPDDDV